jgi:glycerol-3-phosphate acyltransferase PlsY
MCRLCHGFLLTEPSVPPVPPAPLAPPVPSDRASFAACAAFAACLCHLYCLCRLFRLTETPATLDASLLLMLLTFYIARAQFLQAQQLTSTTSATKTTTTTTTTTTTATTTKTTTTTTINIKQHRQQYNNKPIYNNIDINNIVQLQQQPAINKQ